MSKRNWKEPFSLVAMLLSLILLGGSLILGHSPMGTEEAAQRLEKGIGKRMAELDSYMDRALEGFDGEWISFPRLPEDMVVYRYMADTLESWAHQFPLRNDDIRPRILMPRLGSGRGGISSPLSEVTTAASFVNYGPKWYLVKAKESGDRRIIGGLEVSSEADGINPKLGLGGNFSLSPLSTSVGSPVRVGGVPVLKITSESISGGRGTVDYALFWIAVGLFLLSSLLFLSCRRDWGRYLLTVLLQLLLLGASYAYGVFYRDESMIFSPILYADGSILYSLGAVLLINLGFTVFIASTYLMRRQWLRFIRGRNTKLRTALCSAANLVFTLGVAILAHRMFRSIILNSGICLELYKVEILSGYTAIVYGSFFLLFTALFMNLQLLSPHFRSIFKIRGRTFYRVGRIAYAIAVGIYFVVCSSVYGFRKERNRVDVWATRLSMDRDIYLEIQLRTVEGAIASDKVLGALSLLENSNDLVLSRLTETYMARLSQDYDISVINLSALDDAGVRDAILTERISSGTQVTDGSYFFYSRDMNGRGRYTGLYTYYTVQYGPHSILVCVEPKSNREDRGYLSLLGISQPGQVMIPPVYSHAKYVSDRLVTFKGAFAYPSVFPSDISEMPGGVDRQFISRDDYMHFFHRVADDEVVVISRKDIAWVNYVVEIALFAILAFFLITAATGRRNRRVNRGRNYFKDRIYAVVYLSLTLTLVGVAVFSIWFVYNRYETDMNTIMTAKINSIQSMVESRVRQAKTTSEIGTQNVLGAIEYTGNTLKSDISLYTPSGHLLMTTTPDIFDRMILGHLIDESALYQIMKLHNRFYIQQETISRRRFYSLYAPVFNTSGDVIAIVSSPYTDRSHDLGTEAVLHIATILTVFLLFLIIARFVVTMVISTLFKPLSEMSRKMNVTDVDHLDLITYDRDDEISSLVGAYNRMVMDLSESTRKLAQAERDKAWSGMARQVAHEIKNPLTPIKLQLQMLIRMKQGGNPLWEAKFDEVSRIVLEQIDILTNTANEFSTFARLYSEEPQRFDLNALVHDVVTMFEAEQVNLTYLGLKDAWIDGPKPQLTRVMVNLVTNSVQALEGQPDGAVSVSLRNSSRDGFYEVVVEDNGPGVSEENVSKLFTPNFTTKSSGSGLGLAISRTVVERCGGEIRYSKSFTLGGACFTVFYPKLK